MINSRLKKIVLNILVRLLFINDNKHQESANLLHSATTPRHLHICLTTSDLFGWKTWWRAVVTLGSSHKCNACKHEQNNISYILHLKLWSKKITFTTDDHIGYLKKYRLLELWVQIGHCSVFNQVPSILLYVSDVRWLLKWYVTTQCRAHQ